MKKEQFYPVDLGHIQEKILAVIYGLEESDDASRSEQYRIHMAQSARSIARTILSDIAYYMDTKKFGDTTAYGMPDVLSKE